MIKRVKSDPREPTVSDQQRSDLLKLIRQKVQEAHGVVGYDPVVAMAVIGTDPVLNGLEADPLTEVPADPAKGIAGRPAYRRRDTRVVMDAHKEVAKYTRPQLKQIEVTGAGGGPLEVTHTLAGEIADLIGALTGTTAEKGSKA